MNRNAFQKQGMIYLAIAIFLYTLPIVLTNKLQVDDLGRSLTGYSNWSYNGRPLTDFITSMLNLGKPLLNIFPLSLYIGLGTLATSIYTFIKKVDKKNDPITIAICSFLFIANPYLIENMSFQYDSLSMLLSASSIFLVFIVRENIIGYILKTALVLSSLTLYQATISLYFMLFLVVIFDKIRNESKIIEIINMIIKNLMIFITAYFLYNYIILKMVPLDAYSSSHNGTIHLNLEGISTFKYNLGYAKWIINLYLDSIPKVIKILYILIIGASLSTIFVQEFKKKTTIAKKIFNSFFYLVSPLAIFLLTFIHLCLLKSPVWSPRVMIGFGGFMMYIGFLISQSFSRKYFIYSAIPIIYISFVIINSYGNTAKAQNDYDNILMSSISYDIMHFDSKIDRLSIYGNMEPSPQLSLSKERLPIISLLVPIFLNTNDYWGGVKLKHFSIDYKFEDISKEESKFVCSRKAEIETRNYSLHYLQGKIIILFPKNSCGN